MVGKKSDGQQKPLILIVDDVPQNLQVLGNFLSGNDYDISMAANGQKALEMANKIWPDLILLDVIMPEMDGFQVCQELKAKAETKDIPVIFLTAKTQMEDILKGFEVGAVDYVTKPFNKEELLARVSTHVALKNAQKEIVTLEQKNVVLALALTASHELNQPLTVLKGNLELFQNSINKNNLTDRQQNFIKKMEQSIDKIETILEKFTDLDSSSIHFEDYLGKKKMVIFENGDGE
ncbi:MAG: response regulator [Candidatus Aminicenantes bacterium]|nr:response regulator [Candidatus Aminicenantes bacterium]NIM77629.1 response regulator [Candidatus Aminicenantes bacterium]NIN16941.1 response regulator [Candidatus Aminicenantes bacterium]NIN40834.1 response regulator [Candidatus Aminicenantes bacterium]NIN83638.1 response regulator [Candidatus Aminicenantes bacterium]